VGYKMESGREHITPCYRRDRRV